MIGLLVSVLFWTVYVTATVIGARRRRAELERRIARLEQGVGE